MQVYLDDIIDSNISGVWITTTDNWVSIDIGCVSKMLELKHIQGLLFIAKI